MKVQVNGMKDWTPEKPLIPGFYTVRVDSVEDKVSEKTGAPMVLLGLRIVEGPEQPDGKPFDDRMVFDNIITDASGFEKPKAREFIENKLIMAVKAFGIDEEDEFDTADFQGQEAEVSLAIEDGQYGEKRNTVKSYRPIGGFQDN